MVFLPFVAVRRCAQFDFAVSHTVMATIAPSAEDPDEQALGDGAEVAEVEAAGRRVLLEELRGSAMMSRLSSGVMFRSLKTGMFCGPVTIAS